MRTRTTILLIVIASLFFGLGFNFLLHRSSNRVIAEWKQNSSVDYKSAGPYYLSVVEGNRDWSFFLPGWERHYYIYVGRESGKPSYGHSVEFSFYPEYEDDFENYVKKASVEWLETGVNFRAPSGHLLFIPKEMFLGGR